MLCQKGRDGGRAELPSLPSGPEDGAALREPGGKESGPARGCSGGAQLPGQLQLPPSSEERRQGRRPWAEQRAAGPGLPHRRVRGKGSGSGRGHHRQAGAERRVKKELRGQEGRGRGRTAALRGLSAAQDRILR